MATRTREKALRRAARLAREQAQADAERRRERLIRLGGVVLVAVVALAVAIAVSSSGSGKKTTSPTAAREAVSSVNGLLAGIPQSGTTLGNPSAPVQVTVYEDLQCPVCRDFTLAAENRLIANEVRSGRVKLVFRSLRTATPDATTFKAQQQAALAAGRQNKLWYFVELFYDQQGAEGTGYVSESYLDKLARQVPGLDYSQWLAARKSGSFASAVSADESAAQAKGFNSTPTIVVQGPKSSPAPVAGAVDYGSVQRLVKTAGG